MIPPWFGHTEAAFAFFYPLSFSSLFYILPSTRVVRLCHNIVQENVKKKPFEKKTSRKEQETPHGFKSEL